MGKTGFTPGPWRLRARPYEDGKPYFWLEAGKGFYGDDGNGFEVSGIMDSADANLMKAAPDLLAALKPFADLGVGSGPDHEAEIYRIERGAIRAARAALKRARGE